MQLNKEIITSIGNEKALKARALKDSKERKEQQAFLIEGINTLKDIPDSVDIVSLFVNEKSLSDKALKAVITKRNLDYYLVSDKVIASISDTVTPSGAVAVVKMPNFKDKIPKSNCLILDGISDPGNMGTIIRTAAAFSYNDIYCIDCVDFYNNKVVRSTMGGLFRVRLFNITVSEVSTLFKNYELIALDMDGIDIKSYKKQKAKNAIIVGSESKGIRDDLMKLSTVTLSLPMTNNMESLNASIASSIVMFILKD